MIDVPWYLPVAVVAVVALLATFIGRLALLSAIRRERESSAKVREDERLAFLGTLAAGLAHEMRSPLSTLTINLDLLKELWKNPITEREQREYKKIETLLRETRRLEEIVNNFLRFAVGQRLDLRRESTADVLQEASAILPPLENVRIVRDVAPDLPDIMIDRTLFRQALLNVLTNAREAIPDGGDVTLRARKEHGLVRIEVHDTGEGIPEDARQRIFNVYFSTKKGGMGLGLAITKRIIETHGGTIGFTSVPGKGTTFRIDLPIAATST